MAFLCNQLKIRINSECLFILFISPYFIHLFAYGEMHAHISTHGGMFATAEPQPEMTETKFRLSLFGKFQMHFVPV